MVISSRKSFYCGLMIRISSLPIFPGNAGKIPDWSEVQTAQWFGLVADRLADIEYIQIDLSFSKKITTRIFCTSTFPHAISLCYKVWKATWLVRGTVRKTLWFDTFWTHKKRQSLNDIKIQRIGETTWYCKLERWQHFREELPDGCQSFGEQSI